MANFREFLDKTQYLMNTLYMKGLFLCLSFFLNFLPILAKIHTSILLSRLENDFMLILILKYNQNFA